MQQTDTSMLFTKYRLLEHIYDQQLSHLCVVLTGDESEPLHGYLSTIYQQAHSAAVTHRLAICPSITSMTKLLRNCLASHRQLAIYYFVICASAHYRPALRKVIGALSQQIAFSLEVMYFLVDKDSKENSRRTFKQEAKRPHECKFNPKRVGSVKQTVRLQSKLSKIGAVVEINAYLESLIIRQCQQISSKSAPALPIHPVNAKKISSLFCSLQCLISQKPSEKNRKSTLLIEQAGHCLHELLTCFLEPNHPSIVCFKNQAQLLKSFSDIDWALHPDILEVIHTVLSRTTRLEALSYLCFTLWMFDNFWQNQMMEQPWLENEQYTMYLSIQKSQLQQMRLSANQLFITNSWLILTTQGLHTPGSTLICFRIKVSKSNMKYLRKCKQGQKKTQHLLVWPFSIFRICSMDNCFDAEWVGNWEDPNVRSFSNMPMNWGCQIIECFNKCKLNVLPELHSPSSKKAPQLGNYQQISASKWKGRKCIEGKKYEESVAKLRLAQTLMEQKSRSKLQKMRSNARVGKNTIVEKEVFDYFKLCLQLAQLHREADCHHQSLIVLQQCLMHFPIFYNCQEVVTRLRPTFLAGQLNEIDHFAIRILIQYIADFCYSDALEIATQFMSHLMTLMSDQNHSQSYLQLRQNLMLNSCLLIARKRLLTQRGSVEQIQLLEQEVRLYEDGLALFKEPSQESAEVKLKLIECKYSLGKYEECQNLLKECIEFGLILGAPRTFQIECNLKIVACLASEQKFDECIKAYKGMIEQLDEIALQLCESPEATDQTNFFLLLNLKVHASYCRLFSYLGRTEESIGVYGDYLMRKGPEERHVDYYQFLMS